MYISKLETTVGGYEGEDVITITSSQENMDNECMPYVIDISITENIFNESKETKSIKTCLTIQSAEELIENLQNHIKILKENH